MQEQPPPAYTGATDYSSEWNFAINRIVSEALREPYQATAIERAIAFLHDSRLVLSSIPIQQRKFYPYIAPLNSFPHENDCSRQQRQEKVERFTIETLDLFILNTLGELHGVHAYSLSRRQPNNKFIDWKLVVDIYDTAFQILVAALHQADELAARLLQGQDESDSKVSLLCEGLEIAMDKCRNYRQKILESLDKREAYLNNILNPQWEARDAVKEQWGEKQWKTNPSPKRDYALMRLEHEQELRAITNAIERLDMYCMQEMEIMSSAQELTRILEGNRGGGGGVVRGRGGGGGRGGLRGESRGRGRGSSRGGSDAGWRGGDRGGDIGRGGYRGGGDRAGDRDRGRGRGGYRGRGRGSAGNRGRGRGGYDHTQIPPPSEPVSRLPSSPPPSISISGPYSSTNAFALLE